MPETDLTAAELSWVITATKILAGSFDDADGSTLESLRIGLAAVGFRTAGTSFEHPVCQRALEKVMKLKKEAK